MEFNLPGGYVLGPYGPNGQADYAPPNGPTYRLLLQVIGGNDAVQADPGQRREILDELRRIRADAIVAYRIDTLPRLKATLDPLFGPGQAVDDVWVWRLPGQ
jgi:hypothetical protein